MPQAALAYSTPARRALPAPPLPTEYPAVYAVVAHGTCMEPELMDGAPIIVSSTATCGAGDTVIVHLKPEYWHLYEGFEALVKRLKHDLYGTTFPWDPTGSDVIIPVTLEQINPPRRLFIPYDRIQAIHKVLGPGVRSADGGIQAPRSMVEAAQ